MFRDGDGQVDVLKGGNASQLLTDGPNELSLRCLGPIGQGEPVELRAAINGKTVGTAVDQDGLGGPAPTGVGLLVNLDEGAPGPLSVAFDDFDVSVGEDVASAAGAASERPRDPEVAFVDDFTAPTSGWPTDESKAVSAQYGSGVFTVATKKQQVTAAPAAPVAVESDNVRVTAAATLPESSATLYGVFCKSDAKRDNAYIFVVGPAGNYVVAKAERGRPVVLHQAEAPVPFIRRPGEANTIRAECKPAEDGDGTVLQMFVNGRKVVVLTDENGLNGRRYNRVGIYVQSLDPTEVRFDEFEVAEPGR